MTNTPTEHDAATDTDLIFLVGSEGALTRASSSAYEAEAGAWEPILTALSVWERQAQQSQRAVGALADVKRVIAWLRETGNVARNARMEPFAAKSANVWQMLRQESNVDLGRRRTRGTEQYRMAPIDTTWYHQCMAMTLRLSDDQTEALRRRAETEHRSMQQVALAAIDAYVHQPIRERRQAVPVSELLEIFAELPPVDVDAFRADQDRHLDTTAHFDAYERGRRPETAE